MLAQVRGAARQLDPIASATIELLALLIREHKDKLVDAVDHDEILRGQGAARALNRLYRDLTTEPATIKPYADNQER